MDAYEIIEVAQAAAPYPGTLLEVGRRSPGTIYIHSISIATAPAAPPAVLSIYDAKSRVTQRWNLTFSGNPADGETVTHTCVPGSFTRVFEFDSNGAVTSGRIPVLIGANAFETAKNLVAALERAVPGNGVFTNRSTTAPVVQWETYIPGSNVQLPSLFTEASGVLVVAIDAAFTAGATINLLDATHVRHAVYSLTAGDTVPVEQYFNRGVFLSLASAPAVANVHFRFGGARRLWGRANVRVIGEQL